ncbi:MAG: hypothetical protein DRI56_06445 [Chloroflexota bacterium]|nr:MAG: hypothetical protein B6243_09825 [Anaerolineaceae bacterium 4572_5.2]RLD07648.1 MAG: hypothetical protein DRI56_06445 [Chloroflexota bacterium]
MSLDLRKHFKQTNRWLLIGFFVAVFVVGDGLIYLLYGRWSALMGLLCLLGAMVPVAVVGAIFWIMDKAVEKRNEREG